MSTKTQYIKSIEDIKLSDAPMIYIDELSKMSAEQFAERCDALDRRNSIVHVITMDTTARPEVSYIDRHPYWSRKTKKVVAKRYRLPKRC